jgi:hypothetical protein
VNKIALVSLACLALGACSTPTQTVGTLGGVATGAAVGGPVGAVVGGVAGAAITSPAAHSAIVAATATGTATSTTAARQVPLAGRAIRVSLGKSLQASERKAILLL